MRPADDLDANGKAFARKTDGDGGAGETGEIQPLRTAHGVEISRAGAVVSAAMEESGSGGDWGEKDGDLLHLAQDFCAQEIALGAGLDSFIEAGAERDLLRAKILRQMQEVPILLSPVSSAPAFLHGSGNYRPGTGYLDTMRCSQWLNLTGFPGASVPVGLSSEGLPIGIQIIGRPHEDELVLAVAERLEEARGPRQAPPL